MAEEGKTPGAQGAADVKMEKFLIFESDHLLFGANVEYVMEIITNHMITRLPVVPDYVGGIINLRGQIIPVIDIRLRMGKEAQVDCCIVVLSIDGTQAGILVDTVVQMIDVPEGQILPVPAHNTQKLISGMCSLPDGKTMMVLDCDLLLEV